MDTTDNPLDSIPRNEWDAIILKIITPLLPLCSRDTLITSEDLQQEAWIGLLAACDRYDPKKAKFTTFAFHYIRGHVMRYILKTTRHKPNQIDDDVLELDDREFMDTALERKDILETVMSKIGDQQYAHLIIEHFVEGKSLRGLGRRYGVSHETIATRLNKLLQLLEIRLNGQNAVNH